MAECPNCSYKLKPWNVKAECPSCKTNIPNFNWEERLEKDAERSKKAFSMLKERTRNVRSFLFGSRLRKARFFLTFSPLVLLLLPVVEANVNLPFINGETSVSVLTIVLWIINKTLDIGSVTAMLSGEVIGKPLILLLAAEGIFLLAFLCAVISFFLLLIGSISLNNKGSVICNTLSLILSFACIAVFFTAFSAVQASGINFITSPAPGIALAAGSVLYTVNLILNILCLRSLKDEKNSFREKRKAIGKF